MTATDMQIVNVALPTMSRDFGEPLSAVISYLLTLAVVIPASGWIGDRVGTKRTFLFALVLFTVASGLCGVSQSLPQLIAARALQGVGGGLLTPTGTAMLFRAYGPERRRRRAGSSAAATQSFTTAFNRSLEKSSQRQTPEESARVVLRVGCLNPIPGDWPVVGRLSLWSRRPSPTRGSPCC